MKLYKKKFAYRDLLLSIVIFFTVLGLALYGFSNAQRANDTQKLELTRTAIQKSIVSCYAVEGFYPPNLQYLENHYGITVDHSKFIVNYELAGSNIMPSVKIIEKNK